MLDLSKVDQNGLGLKEVSEMTDAEVLYMFRHYSHSLAKQLYYLEFERELCSDYRNEALERGIPQDVLDALEQNPFGGDSI